MHTLVGYIRIIIAIILSFFYRPANFQCPVSILGFFISSCQQLTTPRVKGQTTTGAIKTDRDGA